MHPVVDNKRGEAFDGANEILLDAARLLATSLELDDALKQVMRVVVPRMAEYALLFLRSGDGTYRQEASAHVDPVKAGLLDELGERYQPDLQNPDSHLGTVLRTRRPRVGPAIPDVDRPLSMDPDVLRIYRALAPVSFLVVPLVAHDELLGSLVLVMSVSGRHYSEADLPLAELVGARAALAIDNARLYRETREARNRELRSAQLESQLAKARLEALRAQLNPHFLFNALNVVAMLVRRGANEDALNAVVSLSELLRQVLAAGTTTEVHLADEVALLERYLAVERIRFRDRLSVAIDMPPSLVDARVPGLILQPLVENAIKHGIAQNDGPGRITVAARHEGRRLILRVTDNGPGFPDDWDPSQAPGVGLANVRERLERMYERNAGLTLLRGADGGAVVEIAMPYRTTSSPRA
jgi:GAF domain-containing protein